MILFVFLLLVCVLPTLVYAARYQLREAWRSYRERKTGPLIWYQFRPVSRSEDSRIEDKAKAKRIEDYFRGLASTTSSFGNRSLSPRRGVASIVWYKSSEDDRKLRLYLGVSQTSVVEGSIRALAQSIDCEAVPCGDDIPFDINPGAVQIATGKDISHSQITDDVIDVGAIGTAFANADRYGALILTVDAIASGAERKRLSNLLTENNRLNLGDDGGMQNVGDRATSLSQRGSRCTLSATSESGDVSEASDILSLAISSLGSVPGSLNQTTLQRRHVQLTSIVAVIAFLPVLLGILFTSGMTEMLCISLAVSLLLIVVLSSSLVNGPVRRRAALGEVTVPPFWYFSTRWLVRGNIRFSRKVGSGMQSSNERSAPPSDAQVIYFYGVPLLQYMSFPQYSSDAIDIDRQLVPMIGLPAIFDQDMRPTDVAIGVTGTGQPVFYKAEEINVSRFVGGSPEIGKTNALQCEFLSLSYINHFNQEITKRDGINRFTVTPIWVEMKGKGAIDTYNLTKELGAVLIDCNNPTGDFRLALEGPRLDELMRGVDRGEFSMSYQEAVDLVTLNTNTLVSAAQYGFPPGSIMGQARPTMQAALRIAMLLTEDEYRESGMDNYLANVSRPNIMHAGFLILNGLGTLNVGKYLTDSLMPDLEAEKDSDPRKARLVQSIGALHKFIEGGSRMDSELRSSRQRFQELNTSDSMWEPGLDPSDPGVGRRDIYIDMVCEQDGPVIINTGPYLIPNSNPNDQRYRNSETSTAIIHSGMAIYTIWNYVKANFSGRGERPLDDRKYTVAYYDELSHLAGKESQQGVADVFSEIPSEGRSFGMALAGATQNFGRITEASLREVESMRTKFWMRQTSGTERKKILELLPEGQTNYTSDSFLHLKPGMAVAEMQHGSEITPPFTMMFPKASDWKTLLKDFDGDNVQAIREYIRETSGGRR